MAHFVRAQCSVLGVSGSNPAKINIFIIIALVSTRYVETPVDNFVRAQCSVLGVSGSNPAKINIFFIIALVTLRNMKLLWLILLERSVLFQGLVVQIQQKPTFLS